MSKSDREGSRSSGFRVSFGPQVIVPSYRQSREVRVVAGGREVREGCGLGRKTRGSRLSTVGSDGRIGLRKCQIRSDQIEEGTVQVHGTTFTEIQVLTGEVESSQMKREVQRPKSSQAIYGKSETWDRLEMWWMFCEIDSSSSSSSSSSENLAAIEQATLNLWLWCRLSRSVFECSSPDRSHRSAAQCVQIATNQAQSHGSFLLLGVQSRPLQRVEGENLERKEWVSRHRHAGGGAVRCGAVRCWESWLSVVSLLRFFVWSPIERTLDDFGDRS
ncbi:hypothetical protein DL98DRAFT_525268 [Cadophora sp. DSE1049]|nr:hypothetical protein DL98DRAFT_525268 [Cadophora sp. DSE1049]